MAETGACRSCGATDLKEVVDLGLMPLSDRLMTEEQLKQDEPKFPLRVMFCTHCSLVQITETVDPEVLFCEDYPYFSSFSDTLLAHSKANVDEVVAARGLGPGAFVVELASNDGYLLKNYLPYGIDVLGIDPAEGPAKAAAKVGVETLNTFFTLSLAEQLAAEGKKADVIHGNNVLAHVADSNGFVKGIATLLKDNGVAVIEVPYLRDLVEHCEFDTIYHEHLLYLSVTALDHLFRRHGLFLNDVRRLSIHGGSLRLFVEKKENRQKGVLDLLAEEKQLGMDTIHYYLDFSERVRNVKTKLHDMIAGFKSQGKTVAAYGAAAKGTIMINYAGIGTDLVDFVVDRNIHKQGKYMPGMRIPIYAPEKIMEQKPDYVLLLPWNFADEILSQQAAYREQGGKFIIPIPEPKVV